MTMLNSEKGGALPLVLLILVVFTVLGLTMISMNLSSAKQLNKKEENTQARHLAEMGVVHYRTLIDQKVLSYNSNPTNYLVYVNGKLDSKQSFIKYRNGLESILNVDLREINTELGKYKIVDNKVQSFENKIELAFTSIGYVNSGLAKEINATLTISPITNESNSDINSETELLPQKPLPPENMTSVFTLDDIKNLNSVSVKQASTTKNPFTTSAFVNIENNINLPKKSIWTFNNHLLINGSLSMETSGNNFSTFSVNQDLFISGDLNTVNHNLIQVGGNLSIKGNAKFGTKTELYVNGNAEFKKIDLEPQVRITIQKDAFIYNPLINVKSKASVCVKGTAYLQKENKWKPYEPGDIGYNFLDKSCLKSTQPSDPDPFNWIVLPNVNADYQ